MLRSPRSVLHALMIILGLNAFHPDSSACVLQDGKLVKYWVMVLIIKHEFAS